MNDELFDKYFNEPECYGLRSERFFSTLDVSPEKFQIIEKWMRYTFQAGIEAGYKKAKDELQKHTT